MIPSAIFICAVQADSFMKKMSVFMRHSFVDKLSYDTEETEDNGEKLHTTKSHVFYTINPSGPLNPLFGYLYHTSSLAYYKRFLSYGVVSNSHCACTNTTLYISTDPRSKGKAAKIKRCESFSKTTGSANSRCSQISTRLKDVPLKLCKAPELNENDYLFNYHRCLIGMFGSAERTDVFECTHVSMLTEILSTLSQDVVCKFLAVLFLLPEFPDLRKKLSFVNYENIVFDSKTFSFQMLCGAEVPRSFAEEQSVSKSTDKQAVLNPSKTVNANLNKDDQLNANFGIIRRILTFFSECGTNSEYRRIISLKRDEFVRNGFNSVCLLETPEFLIQTYLYEYSKADPDRFCGVVQNVLLLLVDSECISSINNNINDVSINKDVLIRKYFKEEICDINDITIKRNGNKSTIHRYSKIYGACKKKTKKKQEICIRRRQIKKCNNIEDYCNFYTEITEKINELCGKMSFAPFRMPIEINRIELCGRRKINSSTEGVLLTILCVLFYDEGKRSFTLNHIDSCYKIRPEIKMFFTESFTTPEQLHSYPLSDLSQLLAKLFGDLPDENIRYLHAKEKCGVAPDFCNVLYVLAYVTGLDNILPEISKLRNPPKKNNSVVNSIISLFMIVFKILANNKDLDLYFLNLETTMLDKGEIVSVFGDFAIYNPKKESDIQRSNRVVVSFSSTGSRATYLYSLKECNLVADLVCKLKRKLSSGRAKCMEKNSDLCEETKNICSVCNNSVVSYDKDSELLLIDLIFKAVEYNFGRISRVNEKTDFSKVRAGFLSECQSKADCFIFDDILWKWMAISAGCPDSERMQLIFDFIDILRGKFSEDVVDDNNNRNYGEKCKNFAINLVLNEVSRLKNETAERELLFLTLYGIKSEVYFKNCVCFMKLERRIKNGEIFDGLFRNGFEFLRIPKNLALFLVKSEYKGNVPRILAELLKFKNEFVFNNINYVFLRIYKEEVTKEDSEVLKVIRSDYPSDLDLLISFFVFLLNKDDCMLFESYYVALCILSNDSIDTKVDTKADIKADIKVDTKADTKVDTKADIKADSEGSLRDKIKESLIENHLYESLLKYKNLSKIKWANLMDGLKKQGKDANVVFDVCLKVQELLKEDDRKSKGCKKELLRLKDVWNIQNSQSASHLEEYFTRFMRMLSFRRTL